MFKATRDCLTIHTFGFSNVIVFTKWAHCQGVTSVCPFHIYVLLLQAQGTLMNNIGGKVEPHFTHLDKPKEMLV